MPSAMSASAPKTLRIRVAYGTRFLGMQRVDQSRGTLALRMDDRKQRVIVHTGEDARGRRSTGRRSGAAAALDKLAALSTKNRGEDRARLPRAGGRAARQGFDRVCRSDRQPARSFSRRRSRGRAVQAGPLDFRLPHRRARHGPRRPYRGAARRCDSNSTPRFSTSSRPTICSSRSRPISSISMRGTTRLPSSTPARTASII